MLICTIIDGQYSTMAIAEALRKLSLARVIKNRKKTKTSDGKEVVIIDDGSIEMVSSSRQLDPWCMALYFNLSPSVFLSCRLT